MKPILSCTCLGGRGGSLSKIRIVMDFYEEVSVTVIGYLSDLWFVSCISDFQISI